MISAVENDNDNDNQNKKNNIFLDDTQKKGTPTRRSIEFSIIDNLKERSLKFELEKTCVCPFLEHNMLHST